MSDGNDKILEKLGELSGLMIATREDVKQVSNTQKEHGSSIQTLTASIQVLTSMDVQTKRELGQVNEKLSRDYERINILEKDKNVANGIASYKEGRWNWWQRTLGVVGAVLGILIAANQLSSLKAKVVGTKLKGTPSAYAAPLVPKDTSKISTFVVTTDTIKGDK